MTLLRIAVLQAPAPDFGRAESAWADLLARIDDAAQDEPDLVVLPEASYPAWFLGAAGGAFGPRHCSWGGGGRPSC